MEGGSFPASARYRNEVPVSALTSTFQPLSPEWLVLLGGFPNRPVFPRELVLGPLRWTTVDRERPLE